MSMTIRAPGVLAPLAAVVLFALPSSASSPADDAEIRRGNALFGIHCASCHGRDAAGGGPLAIDLRASVPDLTRMTERADGTFDRAEVRRSIDGTLDVPAHGSREMPVWGLGFGSGVRGTRPEEIDAAIEALLDYLESVQVGNGAVDSGEAGSARP